MRQQLVRLNRQQYLLSCHQKGKSGCCSGLLACCCCCCHYCCPAATRLSVADRCLAVADHCLAVVLGVRVCLLRVLCLLRYLYRADTYREANLDLRTTPDNITYYRKVQSCQVVLPALYRAMTPLYPHYSPFSNEWQRETYTRLQAKN